VGRLTEKPNRYPIFLKTETDTDFGILKTGKYRIPTKITEKPIQSVIFLSPEATLLPAFYNTVECGSMTICIGCVKLVLCVSTIFSLYGSPVSLVLPG